MKPSHLLDAVKSYSPFDDIERQHLSRVLAFLQAEPAPFARMTQQGHITASAVVVDVAHQHMLLIWHEKLQRWLQPGGHCEPDQDADVQATALRELCEETELTPAQVQINPQIFDVDVHLIPARKTEPDHWHYDVRFLFEVNELVEPVEPLKSTLFANGQIKWVPVDEMAGQPDSSLSRLAMKVVQSQPH